MELPGNAGWSLLGDKTIEFARFPNHFIKDRITKHGSKIFLGRVLNKPTVFVTSSQGVKEMIFDKSSSFSMGYKDFGYMHNLYGELLLFKDDEGACRVRKIVKELFHPENCNHYMTQVERITKEKLCSLDARQSMDVYEVFKDLATRIFLYLFLDVDSEADYNNIKHLATTHWHGLISTPVSMKISGWSSGYSKAEESKTHLLQIIHRKLENKKHKGKFIQLVSEAGFRDNDEAAIHILLFISAVIPKALSSLLTSFVYEVAGNNKETRTRLLTDEQFHIDVLLEVQRLWPPFYGGRRYTNEDVIIDGYLIPSGFSVAYISRFANRDNTVFDQADNFLPDRWQAGDKDKRHLVWTFGGGVRCCVGISLVNHIYKHVTKYMSSTYEWTLVGDSSQLFKTLPVTRPKEPMLAVFSRIATTSE